MDSSALGQSPFAVVTFIVAPAMLTNASSVLAMSTINRMLRTRDRMSQLYDHSERGCQSPNESKHLVHLVNRVERQATLLLTALRSVYVALGSFVGATLVTLLGAMLEHVHAGFWFRGFIGVGLVLGVIGVSGLITSCVNLFQATRLSLANISEEAELIRRKQANVPSVIGG